jgi:hypothetical protein
MENYYRSTAAMDMVGEMINPILGDNTFYRNNEFKTKLNPTHFNIKTAYTTEYPLGLFEKVLHYKIPYFKRSASKGYRDNLTWATSIDEAVPDYKIQNNSLLNEMGYKKFILNQNTFPKWGYYSKQRYNIEYLQDFPKNISSIRIKVIRLAF